MEYSDDIVERVRAALMDYHAATASSGFKRTWSNIANEMHKGLLVPPSVDDDDDDNLRDPDKPLAEALRRFASGAQTPSRERLNALALYLKNESYLSDSDLKPAAQSSPLVHALRAFFGESGDAVTARALGFSGSFSASRKNSSGRTELAVLMIRDGNNGTVAVEDKLYSLPVSPQSTKRDALARILKRTGGTEQRFDGWLFHSQGQICLFVQDSLRKNPGVYTVLDRKSGGQASSAHFLLLKSRDFGTPAPGYNQLVHVSQDTTVKETTFARIRDNIWEYRQERGHDGN